MALLTFGRWRHIWEAWNLRGAVLLSLTLQILLILSAPSRKRTKNFTWFVWLAYLLADWIAALAVGIISNGQDNYCPGKNSVPKDVAAFWAPFLLLHLGGPDNITAFSLEDNALWVRHLFGLIVQFFAVAYVFTQSAPNEFWIPTLSVTIAGLIKYGERTCSPYRACLTNFRKSLLPEAEAGPNYAQLMELYLSMDVAGFPVEIDKVTETNVSSSISEEELSKKLDEIALVDYAYYFHRIFRGLIVDYMFSFQERHTSRSFFVKRNAGEAFKVMEIELNFMYDVLYTKSVMVHNKLWFSVMVYIKTVKHISKLRNQCIM